MGTLMAECHLLPGTTFCNPVEKGAYDSEARAVMTRAELETWLAGRGSPASTTIGCIRRLDARR